MVSCWFFLFLSAKDLGERIHLQWTFFCSLRPDFGQSQILWCRICTSFYSHQAAQDPVFGTLYLDAWLSSVSAFGEACCRFFDHPCASWTKERPQAAWAVLQRRGSVSCLCMARCYHAWLGSQWMDYPWKGMELEGAQGLYGTRSWACVQWPYC